MGRTACTGPQCLYKGAFYLLFTDAKVSSSQVLQFSDFSFILNTQPIWRNLTPSPQKMFLFCIKNFQTLFTFKTTTLSYLRFWTISCQSCRVKTWLYLVPILIRGRRTPIYTYITRQTGATFLSYCHLRCTWVPFVCVTLYHCSAFSHRSKHVEQPSNKGIINYPTQLHFVGHFVRILNILNSTHEVPI
jgi:hypothetical protein